MNRDEIIATIRSLPDELDRLLEGLSDQQLRQRPPDGGWSVLEVCCHLRDSAEIEGFRVRRLVEDDNPTLAPYDQDALALERDYQGDNPSRVRTALRAFWGGLAYQLERLSDEQWQRAGTHPEIGQVTAASRAGRMAEHAREHSEQMRVLGESVSGPR